MAIFLFLFFYLLNKLKSYPGVSFFVYLALYSVGRLLIEPIRLDSIMTSNNIPIPIIASAVELLLSMLMILGLAHYHNSIRKKAALIEIDRIRIENSIEDTQEKLRNTRCIRQ